MDFILTLLGSLPYLTWPTIGGWGVWLVLLSLTIWLVWRTRIAYGPRTGWRAIDWVLLIGLFVLVLLSALFFGLRLSVGGALGPQASAKEIALTCEPEPDLARTLQADPALLHQAVYNLVENAVKYTPAGGRVTLRARNAENCLLFSVQDTGIGIPAEELPHLFEKFYRGKQREARAQAGTGLGLAIVRSIAERHGGRVWVKSLAGQGSIFFLQIPLAQPQTGK